MYSLDILKPVHFLIWNQSDVPCLVVQTIAS